LNINTYIPDGLEIKITKDKIYYPEITDGNIKIYNKPNIAILDNIHKKLDSIEFNKFYRSIGGRNAKNRIFESIHAPEIAYVYYFLFTQNMNVPSIECLCRVYLNKYFDCIGSKYKLKDCYFSIDKCKILFNQNDIFGRICRAYNSFNREIELLYNLFQYDEFEVFYDLRTDVFDGIDISILYKDTLYGIFVYQDSVNANRYRNLKSTTRHKFSNLVAMFLPAIFFNRDGKVSNIVDHGDIGTFSKSTVNDIKETIVDNSNKIETRIY